MNPKFSIGDTIYSRKTGWVQVIVGVKTIAEIDYYELHSQKSADLGFNALSYTNVRFAPERFMTEEEYAASCLTQ